VVTQIEEPVNVKWPIAAADPATVRASAPDVRVLCRPLPVARVRFAVTALACQELPACQEDQ
jgi:hypothetical protein